MAEPKKSEEREEEKKDAQTEERSEKREERHAHEDEKKKDSKREEHGKRSSSKKRDHESRVEKRAKAESDNEIHAWTDGIVGLLWIVVFYISGATYPIPKIGQWNLAVGGGIAFVGFLMTMRWR